MLNNMKEDKTLNLTFKIPGKKKLQFFVYKNLEKPIKNNSILKQDYNFKLKKKVQGFNVNCKLIV